jgi:hypothetical protein
MLVRHDLFPSFSRCFIMARAAAKEKGAVHAAPGLFFHPESKGQYAMPP